MSSWQRFWWWTPGKTWPANVKDVLKDAFGLCKPNNPYCFQRLPSWAEEDATELLAVDSDGTVYQWKFDSKNPTAHSVWQAFHDHQETPHGKIMNKQAWDPLVVEGNEVKATQDSFMYREQNGVKSLLLDDDNCDCLSTLSMGHGMCNAGHSISYSKPNVFGVDKLYDPGCRDMSRTISKLWPFTVLSSSQKAYSGRLWWGMESILVVGKGFNLATTRKRYPWKPIWFM